MGYAGEVPPPPSRATRSLKRVVYHGGLRHVVRLLLYSLNGIEHSRTWLTRTKLVFSRNPNRRWADARDLTQTEIRQC